MDSPPGRLAGIDFGTVRIGIALSDPEQRLASPYENYTRRSPPLDAQYFKTLAREELIVRFVVGLPVHLSGHESEMSRQARAFGEWLATQTGVRVVYSDERFSSSDAEEHLLAAGLTKKRRKARLDMLAAQQFLTAYLESPRCQADNEGILSDDAPQGLGD